MREATATVVLYLELRRLLDSLPASYPGIAPVAAGLRGVMLDALCGVLDVGGRQDIVRALWMVPEHERINDQRAHLITMIECDALPYGGPDVARWSVRVATARARSRSLLPPGLPKQSSRVHWWLYRYAQVYGQGPLVTELASGTGGSRLQARQCLGILEQYGQAVYFGGQRGWLPTGRP
jgi:hypothetical protein